MTAPSRRGILGAAAVLPLLASGKAAPMPRVGLGYVTQLGISDAGLNINPYLMGTGWDVIFTPDIIASKETEFEVYQIALDGPIGSAVLVSIDGHPYNYVNQGWANAYDPSQPMLLTSGNTVQFLWNFAYAAGPYNRTSNIQPTVTMYFRRTQGIIA